MKRLLLAGAILLTLPLSARADLVWNIEPFDDTLDNLQITGQIFTDDTGAPTGILATVISGVNGTDVFDTTNGTEIETVLYTGSGTLSFNNNPSGTVLYPGSFLSFDFSTGIGALAAPGGEIAINVITYGSLADGGVLFMIAADNTTDVTTNELPEPMSLAILGFGLAGTIYAKRRR